MARTRGRKKRFGPAALTPDLLAFLVGVYGKHGNRSFKLAAAAPNVRRGMAQVFINQLSQFGKELFLQDQEDFYYLTPAGAEFAERAAAVSAGHGELWRWLTSAAPMTVVIDVGSTALSVMLPPVVQRFVERSPDANLLFVDNPDAESIMNAVRAGRAHFAVNTLTRQGDGDFEVPPGAVGPIEKECISDDEYELLAVTAPGYKPPDGVVAFPRDKVSLKHLASHTLFLTPGDKKHLEEKLAADNLAPRRTVVAGTYLVVEALVRQGAGVGLVPKLLGFPRGLEEHQLDPPLWTAKVALFYHRDRMREWQTDSKHPAVIFREMLLELARAGGPSPGEATGGGTQERGETRRRRGRAR